MPLRLRPQKFCGKGGKVVNRPYDLRIPNPKRETRVVGGSQDLHPDTRRGAGPNSTRALRPSMGSRAQKQAKPKIRGYPLQHTLPPRQRGYGRFHVGTSKGHQSNFLPTRYPSLFSVIPCHCHKSGRLRTLLKFPLSERQGRKECKKLPHRVSLRSREVHARRVRRGVDCPKELALPLPQVGARQQTPIPTF